MRKSDLIEQRIQETEIRVEDPEPQALTAIVGMIEGKLKRVRKIRWPGVPVFKSSAIAKAPVIAIGTPTAA